MQSKPADHLPVHFLALNFLLQAADHLLQLHNARLSDGGPAQPEPSLQDRAVVFAEGERGSAFGQFR